MQDGIINEYIEKLSRRVAELKLGPGFTEGINQGPLINQRAIDKVRMSLQFNVCYTNTCALKVTRLVDDATSNGAEIVTGGGIDNNLGRYFYRPSVMANMNSKMMMNYEEIFGPIAPITK